MKYGNKKDMHSGKMSKGKSGKHKMGKGSKHSSPMPAGRPPKPA